MLSRKALTRLLALAAVALVLVAVGACSKAIPQSTFDPKGPVAQTQLNLFWLIFWLAVVVFVGVEGLLVFMVIRFRRRPNQQGLPSQTHGNTKLEIGWTLIPVIILIVIAIPTYITIADQHEPPKDRPQLSVKVVAHQWWWEFEYPELGIVTANELRVPIDTAVDLALTSQDVIHSFWIPKLAGKTDVVPNRHNKMYFIAPEPDTYYGQCAELCGLSHAKMRFRVISQTQADFDAWVKAQQVPPMGPQDDLAKKGQALFGAKGCVVCHTVSGLDKPDVGEPRTEEFKPGTQTSRMNGFLAGSAIFPAPNLTSFATRTTFAGGTETLNVENLRAWVHNPDDLKPGNRMAQLASAYQKGAAKMTDEEVNAIVAYLMGLRPDLNAPTATPTAVAPKPTPTGGPGPTAAPSGDMQIGTVGNDNKFDKDRLVVKAGSQVKVTLTNGSTIKGLQHTWVLIRAGTEDAVGEAGAAAGPSKEYVPENDARVLTHVKLTDAGGTSQVAFTAPAAGMYAYICTFPGHYLTMRGVFEVTA